MALARTSGRPQGAGVGIEGDQVGHLQPEQRLDQVVQVGDEQPGAGLAGRDRLPVGVDVLDQGGVLEQVDALVVLALGTEQPRRPSRLTKSSSALISFCSGSTLTVISSAPVSAVPATRLARVRARRSRDRPLG
jgi:hypothetical protein